MARQRVENVVAVFAPADGEHNINLTTPSGHDYSIRYRVPFEIEGEDVEWFFNSWKFGQSLIEYQPPKITEFVVNDRSVPICPTCGHVVGADAKTTFIAEEKPDADVEPAPTKTPVASAHGKE